MWALPVTLGAFALILILARFKVPLAAAILLGTLAMGLAFDLGPVDVARECWLGLIQAKTLALILITVLLLAMSITMQSAGQLEKIVTLVKALLRRPVVAMAALPALIGLLPMPGGALFSAPMVESAASGAETPGAKLSAINYWFRHLWEYWWPLYPGVILMMSLTEFDVLVVLAYGIPMSLLMAASGMLILRGMHPDLHATAPPPPSGTKRKLVKVTSSIWLILLIWGIGKLVLYLTLGKAPKSPANDWETIQVTMHSYLPITIGLIVSLIWTTWMNHLTGEQLKKIWGGKKAYDMGLLVASIMIFQYLLGAVDAPSRISQELQAANVPMVAVIAILPFIAGLVTGLAVGFVGTSFPIILGLMYTLAGEGSIVPYVALAYGFGHIGQMMSPMHLCHVVSNKYFKTTFGPGYRLLVPAGLAQSCLIVGYFLLLKLILG